MDKKTYFLNWLKARCFTKRVNLIRMFAINITQKTNFELNPIDKKRIDDGEITLRDIYNDDYLLCHNGVNYYTMVNGETIILDKYNNTKPFIDVKEQLILKSGDLPNIKEDTLTTYGLLFLNYYCFIDIIKGKFNYVNRHLNTCTPLEEALFKQNRLPTDDPNHLEIATEINPCRNRLQQLGTLTTLFVPAATRKLLSSPKEIIAKRDELLKQYTKPDGTISVTDVTMIQNILKEDMKKYVESDEDYGGLITERSWGNTLMGMNVMVGAVQRFDRPGQYDVITECFTDGVSPKNMAKFTNIARAGSFYRGHETQLAGVKVKELQRVIDNQVTLEDCGSRRYLVVKLSSSNISTYLGRYHMVGGSKALITKEDVGKTIMLRSPTRCNAPSPNLCLTCMGEIFRGYEKKIPVMSSQPASDMLNNMMKAMHDTTIRLQNYDPIVAFN
jgi:hypothetical protein